MRNNCDVISVNPSFLVVEDTDDWIVVNKAAPLIVHPASDKSEPTLLGGVEALLSYEIENGARLSIINRLDRETNGLVLIAKNSSAARMFGRAMERRQFVKEYDALCYGWPEWDEISVDQPILRKGEVCDSPIWVKQMVHPEGKECFTRFSLIGKFKVAGKKVSLLRVFPKMGRMHQIRVHLEFLGHPLVGDKIYGPDEQIYLSYIDGKISESMVDSLMLPRHALHAAKMTVTIEGESLAWSVDIAADLKTFLDAGVTGV